jgi:hypothetical protein
MINYRHLQLSSTLAVVIMSLLLGGCAKSSSTVLKAYPPRADDYPIEVLSAPPTDKKFEEVALIDAKGAQHTFADRSTAGVIEQLKAEARKVGADAIVIRSTEGGNYNWGQGGWDRAKADAIAIRFIESEE